MTHPLRDRVRATVVAGSRTIDYQVEGSGTPLILIANDRERWLRHFARTHRVIAPDFDAGQAPALGWLPDFLDGLGLEGVAIALEVELAPLLDLLPACVRERATVIALLGHSCESGNPG